MAKKGDFSNSGAPGERYVLVSERTIHWGFIGRFIEAPYAVTTVLPIGQAACLPLMADIVSFASGFSSPSGAACL